MIIFKMIYRPFEDLSEIMKDIIGNLLAELQIQPLKYEIITLCVPL
jgi:hypothetical protein